MVGAPRDPELLELLPPPLGAVLARELRARAGLAVADVGCVTHGAARELVAAADHLVVVVTPDLRAASAARALVTAAARWGAPTASARLLVNRWNRFAELSAGGVKRAVGSPVLAVIRDRGRGMQGYRNGRADLAGWPAGTPFARLRPVVERLAGGLA
jgi:Flp pilus assembly CpaE family ATPase